MSTSTAARPSYHGPRIVTSTPHHNRVAFARRCLQKVGQSSSQSRTIIPRQMLPPFSSLGHTEIKLSPEMVPTGKYTMSAASTSLAKARALQARKENDAMVYLDGAQIYTCAMCRTHLTSHDDVVSKSFQGHHGRAFLFDQCVNVDIGKPEDRMLLTGLHSVCDITCKRCKTLVGWTYLKCYEPSQRYKERKFIIEKMFIHMEDNPNYDGIPSPAGEKTDKWRQRSMSWGADSSTSSQSSLVYEYHVNIPSEDEQRSNTIAGMSAVCNKRKT